MDLILWRHAEAEDASDDMVRCLTRKGQQQARMMSAWLHDRLPSEFVLLASEARRSQQTAAVLSKGYHVLSAINPGASLDDVLATLAEQHLDGTVILVGHQPCLGRLAARLMCGDPQYWSIKKGAIWWLSIRQQPGGDSVRLKAMMTPAMLSERGC